MDGTHECMMKTLMTVIKSNNTDKRPNGDRSSNIKLKSEKAKEKSVLVNKGCIKN